VRYMQALAQGTMSANAVSVADAGGYFTGGDVEAVTQEIGARSRLVVYATDPQFGCDNTGATDCTAGLAALRAYVAANATRVKAVFPSGIYKFATFPNFAIKDACVVNAGEVRLRYTGTGIAVDLDGGDAGGGITKVIFGEGNGFIIECPATATNALRVRSVHHSKIYARLRGAGSTSAALKTQWCVCTEFYTPCSEVDEPWYLGAAPAIGWDLDQRGTSEQTSYCTFIQPLVEHPAIGIKLTSTLGNVFLGGTSEGCASYGVLTTANAFKDKFIGTDFEGNGTDCFIQGSQIHLIGCDSATNVTFGSTSRYCVMTGGVHQTVLTDAGSSFNRFGNFTYNQLGTTGTFTDAGSGTILDAGIVNLTGGAAYLTGSKTYDPPNVASLNATTTTVTVTGAALGDTAIASFSLSTAAFVVTAQVTSANTVTVAFLNITGAAVDLASGTLKVNVFRR